MIYSIDRGELITKLPHEKDFNARRKSIGDNEYNIIVNELNNRIDGDEVHTAGWMPGHDWDNTVFKPIYQACGKNKDIAGQLFGLIVFKVFMDRDDNWGCGRYEKDGKPIRSMTYFRLKYI